MKPRPSTEHGNVLLSSHRCVISMPERTGTGSGTGSDSSSESEDDSSDDDDDDSSDEFGSGDDSERRDSGLLFCCSAAVG